MLQRLQKRGETSGRDDDNMETIRKRFGEFQFLSMSLATMLICSARSHLQRDDDASH